MKKIAGIILILAVLVGAPLAWHYHSPLPFLPPFSEDESMPPVSPVISDESPQPDGAEEEPRGTESASPLPPPPVASDITESENPSSSEISEDEEIFTLEAVEASEDSSGSTSGLEGSVGEEMGTPSFSQEALPPPLPVLPPEG